MDRGRAVGKWLAQRRASLDLTQEQLAELVGCQKDTISFIETGRRRPSQQLAAILADRLQIAEALRSDFIRFMRRFPSTSFEEELVPFLELSETPPSTGRLPAEVTPLIGREQEVATVCTLVRRPEVRLVTLTGPAGVGKTRLALKVAACEASDISSNVWFVQLSAIREPNRVLPAIMRTLGIKEVAGQTPFERLTTELQDKQALLILDNFEQVQSAAYLLAELLAAIPQVTLLVTSRVRLWISAEHIFRVTPLAIPSEVELLSRSSTALARYDSIKLFNERAEAANPDLQHDERTMVVIASICVQLDGLPLAIELAAAQVRILSPQAILKRLQAHVPVLAEGVIDAEPHQRTLSAALDWSYDLLSPSQKDLFANLAVFIGGCTIDAAEYVLGKLNIAPSEVFNGLVGLLDHSLLQQQDDPDGEPRFMMLEIIRQYALTRFVSSLLNPVVQRGHAEFYAELAEAAGPCLTGSEQDEWFTRLEQENENFRAAMQWLLRDGQARVVLRIGCALWRFWLVHGHMNEERSLLLAALSVSGASDQQLRAEALIAVANLSVSQGDYSEALVHLEESRGLFEKLGDKYGLASTLSTLGHVALNQGNYIEARKYNEMSLVLRREAGDMRRVGAALNNLADVVLAEGDYERASVLADESISVLRPLGNTYSLSIAFVSAGFAALRQKLSQRAINYFKESLVIKQRLWDQEGIAWCLEGLAEAMNACGQPADAVLLLSAAATVRNLINIPLRPTERVANEQLIAIIRAKLDNETWNKIWVEGGMMPLGEVVNRALAIDYKEEIHNPAK